MNNRYSNDNNSNDLPIISLDSGLFISFWVKHDQSFTNIDRSFWYLRIVREPCFSGVAYGKSHNIIVFEYKFKANLSHKWIANHCISSSNSAPHQNEVNWRNNSFLGTYVFFENRLTPLTSIWVCGVDFCET